MKKIKTGETLFLEIHKKDIRVSRDWVGDHWVDLETNPNILSSIPISQKVIKNENMPISPLQTPDPGTLPETLETINNNKPIQEGGDTDCNTTTESHEKENDSPSSPHDNDDDKNVEAGEKAEEMECETLKENLEANPVEMMS